jgi:CRP-like cAMP-binding protein
VALWRGPAYKIDGYHFRAKEKRRSRDGLSCHYMTRELIANTLGVRRAGITEAAGRLQLAEAASIGRRGKRLVSLRTRKRLNE